tara:strand:- start:85 stop:297 length:213 start_codon:yes stop_codon:yes gene_type:complete
MDIEQKAQSWCLKNRVKIYIVPIRNTRKCKIEVWDNGKTFLSPDIYKNQSIASSKIWELYVHIYNQNKKN